MCSAPRDTGGVVALGDSLTDGNISTIDAFCRWPDQLARRLVARGGRPIGVMNNGLGGNRILHDIRGDSGLRRFDRDVLAQPGVTHVDRHARHQRSAQPLGQARGGGHRRADDRRPAADGGCAPTAAGIKIIGATLTPFGNETFMANAWNPTREKHRVAVNNWISAERRL